MNHTLPEPTHMYNVDTLYDYDSYMNLDTMLNNRLLCTFTPLEELDILVGTLSRTYKGRA